MNFAVIVMQPCKSSKHIASFKKHKWEERKCCHEIGRYTTEEGCGTQALQCGLFSDLKKYTIIDNHSVHVQTKWP
jgi:hypothetical protein